ncbi:tetratricopeptide repeat protein [Ulvibacterium sp.]|uniref:tetratricopeptide repeat-containing sensor histidine kinase n=1 Tax=Ulvibacterium sp. TaxID=2665914 RepID=UPI0026167022|nr:tetratricopeptide repeat protein [Ulvibacterium sp.]
MRSGIKQLVPIGFFLVFTKSKLYWSIFLFLVSYGCISQYVPASFKNTIDNVLQSDPSYTEIHTLLRSHRNDTVLMRHLLNSASENGYIKGQAYALNQLGRRYRNLSQYTKAIALHQKALDLVVESKHLEFEVSSLNMLGVAYRRTSSIRTAMDYNQRALELAETVENPSLGLKRNINVSLNCIGNLYQLLKQYDQAIEHFERSLRLETELGNILGLAVNYQNIGECLEEKGQLDKALQNYRTSLSHNETIDNDMGRVICKNSIAQIYIKQDKSEEAIALLEPTLAVAQQLGDGFLLSPARITLGWAQLLAGKIKDAKENMLLGLQIAEKYNLRRESAQASHLLSELFQQTRDYRQALNYKIKAENLDNEILNESTVRYVNDVIFRYDSEKKGNQIEVLAKENEIVRLKLRKNNQTLLASGIALALLAGIFYILYRQYQLKNEKKLLTLEQSMLRSQMNPHFLFNSLNSIKLYIINNEQKNAVHYLNKFSKLIRKILEASSLKEIPLAEELETVELYMNIENIRFSNEIDFKIIVDGDIDVHQVKIPSLILQPFLENALWHGLSSKEGEKKIGLHISKGKDGFVHIAIMDNGVGRDAAEKIKEGKVLKRKSVGIDITKERLANFSRDYQNSFEVEIIDLFDENGKPSGTKVILHIPTV